MQLHLDFRCLPGGRAAQDALLASLTESAVAGKKLVLPVLVAGAVARSAPLAFRAVVRPEVLEGLLKSAPQGADTRFTSLVLEIGPKETVLKGVLSQTPMPFSLAEAKFLLGSDFGYVNTASAAMVKVDAPLDAAWLEEVRDWTKKQSKEYLETHSHGGSAVRELMFNGRNFLARINVHALRVDGLRSGIDRCYNRLARLKYEINRALGRPADTRVDLDAVLPVARAADLTPRFARLLGVVQHLKLLRRQVYRTVAGLKKSWFGFVSGKLAALCARHKAAYVREDLTVLAKEKASPDYKGRTFNKMLNNGAKGQFLRRMSDKLRWMGVPEIVVPSWYTSTTDVRNSRVDKKQRSGETFVAKADGRRMHADLHAALTLALWPLLRPNEGMALAA